MTATIERPVEVNGTLFNALASVQELPNCTVEQAHDLLAQRFANSRLYWFHKDGHHIAVHSHFHTKRLALVSE